MYIKNQLGGSTDTDDEDNWTGPTFNSPLMDAHNDVLLLMTIRWHTSMWRANQQFEISILFSL